MYEITMTTDGSCLGNPGPGGWAAVMRCNGQVYEIAGYEPESTNNKMELRAVIEATRKVKKPCLITLRSDSTYVLDNMKKDFEAIGFKTKTGKAVANRTMWQEMTDIRKGVTFQYVKIPAHTGDPDNERCDYLAKKAIADHQPKQKPVPLLQYVSRLEGQK